MPSHAKQLLRIRLQAASMGYEEWRQLREELEDQAAAARPLKSGSEEASEEVSDLESEEDVEDWPSLECDGVALWGPKLCERWARCNKFRCVAVGDDMLLAPPYHCGQVLHVDLSREEVRLLGEPPPKPPKTLRAISLDSF